MFERHRRQQPDDRTPAADNAIAATQESGDPDVLVDQRYDLLTALPFLVIGTACVIAGGFVAAVTAHAPTEHASWAAAYLVLVGGVAQVALGAGQTLLARHRPSARLVVVELLTWNLGNAAVVAGTVSGVAPVNDVGGALLVVALALLLASTRGPRQAGWPLALYRTLIVIVLVSIPVGLLLAELRPR